MNADREADRTTRVAAPSADARPLVRRLRLLLLGFALLAFVLDGRRTPVLCPFRIVVGRPCPVCGTTRAVGRLMHGDLRSARQLNGVSAVLFVPVAIAVLAAGLRPRARADHSPPGPRDHDDRPPDAVAA